MSAVSVKATIPSPIASAKVAGLRYITDRHPGFSRRKTGAKSFRYLNEKGRPLRDHHDLLRIKRLAIPPAWTEVWISPLENGHLQATGRDARGRKQYRYHADWRSVRDETKYEHLRDFGRALPRIRRHVAHDLAKPGLPREKVLATIVRLLESTLIRVGNDEYARENASYGLTTMRNRHVSIHGAKVTFKFRGKSGKPHEISVENPKLARIVRKCRDLPGYDLFEYLDAEGSPASVTSSDVNAYLQQITGQDFTAKDFRTWAGTILAARALQEFRAFSSQREAKRNVLRAIEAVSQMLGNTPAICRRCYIHPTVLDTYLDGSLVRRLRRKAAQKLMRDIHHLRPEEAAVMVLLHDNLSRP